MERENISISNMGKCESTLILAEMEVEQDRRQASRAALAQRCELVPKTHLLSYISSQESKMGTRGSLVGRKLPWVRQPRAACLLSPTE